MVNDGMANAPAGHASDFEVAPALVRDGSVAMLAGVLADDWVVDREVAGQRIQARSRSLSRPLTTNFCHCLRVHIKTSSSVTFASRRKELHR